MIIDVIEIKIKERKSAIRTLSSIRERVRHNNNVLQSKIMNNIENGVDSYHISTLMMYIVGLDFTLKVNDVKVTTAKELGIQLKKYRESQNLTRLILSERTGLTTDRIKNIELGKGNRGNLVKYINGLPKLPIELCD